MNKIIFLSITMVLVSSCFKVKLEPVSGEDKIAGVGKLETASNYLSGNSVAACTDGGYIIAGGEEKQGISFEGNNNYLNDISIIKSDKTGNKIWRKDYGGSGDDVANSIITTPDGGYLVVGESDSKDRDVAGNHGGFDMWVMKLDNNGLLQWQKSLGGIGYETANSVVVSSDGGYIIVGATSYSVDNGDVSGAHGNAKDVWVVKLSNNGQLLWQSTFGGYNDDEAQSIVQAKGGGFLIAGYASSNDGNVTGIHGNKDIWVIKIDEDGKLIWQKTYGGSQSDVANSIASSQDGNYVIAGYTSSDDGDVTGYDSKFKGGGTDAWILKIDGVGHLIYQKVFGGQLNANALSIVRKNSGGYILAGFTNNGNYPLDKNSSPNSLIINLDENANTIWKAVLGYGNAAKCIINASDGGYIVTGADYPGIVLFKLND